MAEQRREHDESIAQLREEVAELKKAVADLVEAWRAAKGFLGFIKWAASLGAACAVIWSAMHSK